MYVASVQWKNCCFSYLIYSVLESKSNLEARKRNGLFEAFDYATDVEKKKKKPHERTRLPWYTRLLSSITLHGLLTLAFMQIVHLSPYIR